MVMQYFFYGTLLHYEILIKLFFPELLLGINIEPVPHRIPEIALIYIRIVEGLEKQPAFLQIVNILGDILP